MPLVRDRVVLGFGNLVEPLSNLVEVKVGVQGVVRPVGPGPDIDPVALRDAGIGQAYAEASDPLTALAGAAPIRSECRSVSGSMPFPLSSTAIFSTRCRAF